MYKITCKTIFIENETPITLYGIENGKTEYAELSSDVNEITALCNTCNELKLDEIHFKDVVEDFIVSKACGIPVEKDR